MPPSLSTETLSPPRVLTLERPVRLILFGGFLGAGKTTALSALAQHLIGEGRREAPLPRGAVHP